MRFKFLHRSKNIFLSDTVFNARSRTYTSGRVQSHICSHLRAEEYKEVDPFYLMWDLDLALNIPCNTTMSKSVLSITENAQSNMPSPIGHSFIWLFTVRSNTALTCVAWSILTLFISELVCDLTDLISGRFRAFFLTTKYGKAEPIIMLMSYCHTQMALFMAAYTVAFLLLKAHDLTRCWKVLEGLCGKLDASYSRLRPRLMWLRGTFAAVAALSFLAVALGLFDPEFRKTFLESRSYGCFISAAPGGALRLYFIRYCLHLHTWDFTASNPHSIM